MNYVAPKGTKDILPSEVKSWQALESLFSQVAERYGFGEIRVPTFESTELFQRGVGDGTDVVQKEMYTFLDKGGRSMTLRPEGTAGVVRSFIQRGMSSLPFPIKLYYMVNAFRYENVQEGRYREFHQLGVEALGSAEPEVDAEVIALLQQFFEAIGLKETKLHLNSIGCPLCRSAYEAALKAYYEPKRAELCSDCQTRMERNPMRLLDCKQSACQKIATEAPIILDYLDEGCEAHFARVRELLERLAVPYEVTPRLVRGLDYYTKTVFEYVSENVGTQGTICGGGRYDGLVEELGGPSVPACGFAIGEERLLKEVQAQGISLVEENVQGLFLAHRGDEAKLKAFQLAQELRKAGLHCQTDVCARSLKAQMKYAAKSGLSHVLVLGETELESGQGQLRRLSDGKETLVEWNELDSLLQAMKG